MYCKPKNKNRGGLAMRLHRVQCGKTGGGGGVIKMAWGAPASMQHKD